MNWYSPEAGEYQLLELGTRCSSHKNMGNDEFPFFWAMCEELEVAEAASECPY